jgi:RNA polymerase sigma factor (TIGR02999 family)
MPEHEQHEIYEQQEITDALAVLRRGAPEALDELLPLVYSDLRRIAHRQLAAEPTGHTLSTTALVHEAYLRFAREDRAEWSNRPQFFAIAARIMRRVLVDYARRHWAQRRGGVGQQWVQLEEADDAGALAIASRADDLIALDEALERLAAVDERLGRVVECRFFGGLTEAETAEALGISQRTVARDWLMARGWLYRELQNDVS